MSSKDEVKRFVDEFIKWWLGSRHRLNGAEISRTSNYFKGLSESLSSRNNYEYLNFVSTFGNLFAANERLQFEMLRISFVNALNSLDQNNDFERIKAAEEFRYLAARLLNY